MLVFQQILRTYLMNGPLVVKDKLAKIKSKNTLQEFGY